MSASMMLLCMFISVSMMLLCMLMSASMTLLYMFISASMLLLCMLMSAYMTLLCMFIFASMMLLFMFISASMMPLVFLFLSASWQILLRIPGHLQSLLLFIHGPSLPTQHPTHVHPHGLLPWWQSAQRPGSSPQYPSPPRGVFPLSPDPPYS